MAGDDSIYTLNLYCRWGGLKPQCSYLTSSGSRVLLLPMHLVHGVRAMSKYKRTKALLELMATFSNVCLKRISEDCRSQIKDNLNLEMLGERFNKRLASLFKNE